eukprot:77292-Chlamydomonas_euryale.AAC.2
MPVARQSDVDMLTWWLPSSVTLASAYVMALGGGGGAGAGWFCGVGGGRGGGGLAYERLKERSAGMHGKAAGSAGAGWRIPNHDQWQPRSSNRASDRRINAKHERPKHTNHPRPNQQLARWPTH